MSAVNRDAFFAQHRVPQALECARNDVKLIAQGIYDLLNPALSFKVKRTIDDLAELASAFGPKAPASIVEPLQVLRDRAGAGRRRRWLGADRLEGGVRAQRRVGPGSGGILRCPGSRSSTCTARCRTTGARRSRSCSSAGADPRSGGRLTFSTLPCRK
jgi:hypothetical protein